MTRRLCHIQGRGAAPKLRHLKVVFSLLLMVASLLWSSPASAAFDPSKHDLEYILYLELKTGRVVIKTYPDVAPKTVARIKELVRQGFYNGLTFHRVIPEFMAQTGDPRGDGSGGSGQNLGPEFSDRHHLRGTLSMARGSDENSADSQFFIMFQPKLSLDGEYTIWGRVIDGMNNVDAIKKGSAGYRDGEVINPDSIVSMSVAADVAEPIVPAQPKLESYQPPEAPVDLYPAPPTTDFPGYTQPKQPGSQIPNSTGNETGRTNQETSTNNWERPAPTVPLPQWPIEPPVYDTVFPPIPQGGYMPY